MREKLFFLTYLFDYLIDLIDDADIQPTLVQIAEHGFTDAVYSSAFYEKILRTKTSEFDDLYARLRKRGDNAPRILTEVLEDIIYDSARKKYPPKAPCPKNEGSLQSLQPLSQ